MDQGKGILVFFCFFVMGKGKGKGDWSRNLNGNTWLLGA